jgi:hypothetical protein
MGRTTAMKNVISHLRESDHGLPLVHLKEQRRNLIIALQHGSPKMHELMEIAAIQQAISACEEVIADLDAEIEPQPTSAKLLVLADVRGRSG